MHCYLDHAASTPIKPQAVDAMVEVLRDPDLQANPSSGHSRGKLARARLEEYRERVARHFACNPADVVFNSGGSEGDAHALIGAVRLLDKPCHIAFSAIEHEAVEATCVRLQQLGYRLSRLPVTAEGAVPLEAVENLLAFDRPDVISIMAVNNEVGTVQPVRQVATRCRERNVLFHTDAVRAVGHGLPDIERDPNITLLNGTAHKFGGPRGVGVLIQRSIRLPQLVYGGSQEHGSRAGTENLAGVAGFVAALELATAEEAERLEALRHSLEQQLLTEQPGTIIHGSGASRATHVTSAAIPGHYNRELQAKLDACGICIGTGKACHDSHSADASGVLGAMGVPFDLQRATLRISLGWTSTAADTALLLGALRELTPASAATR